MNETTIRKWKSEFTELLQVPKITTYVDDDIIMILRYMTGLSLLHRIPGSGPALLSYNKETSNIEYVFYYVDDKLHRDQDDGPAEIWFNQNGTMIHQVYYVNGLKHKDGKPADIYYHPNENIISQESYYIHGMLHRIDGPAKIWYSKTGTILKKEYYLEGQKVNKTNIQLSLLK